MRSSAGIGTLADPVRQELYLFVSAQPGPVSRDQAAEAIGIARHKAKFHLDRLESEGLLEAVYARLTGRTGLGAGRSSKLYRRAAREFAVSLRHALAEAQRELVCHMNHALITGLVESVAPPQVEARWEPGDNRCCVSLAMEGQTGGRSG
ncbi:hypothetical protein OHA25_20760 [Nonomuraea sp. NBC_00507]|uniref:helix-turn-helix domain-containing protein n=1 Tax=Nonomuraea sp. NBC_00507 TaxID=2976002 RepID=UPI002E193AE9